MGLVNKSWQTANANDSALAAITESTGGTASEKQLAADAEQTKTLAFDSVAWDEAEYYERIKINIPSPVSMAVITTWVRVCCASSITRGFRHIKRKQLYW